jgi:hypothetical protein
MTDWYVGRDFSPAKGHGVARASRPGLPPSLKLWRTAVALAKAVSPGTAYGADAALSSSAIADAAFCPAD